MDWEPRTPPEGINVTPTHPLSELAMLVAGIAAGTAILVVFAALSIEILMAWLPTSLESRLFGRLWTFESTDESNDPRQTEVEALLQRLAVHWPENPYTLRLEVMDEQDPNAFALPGGLVVVTQGLLDEIGSENELAFVLGHELGHFRNRDHLRGLGRGVLVTLTLTALSGGGGADVIPGVVSAVTETGFARDQERDADRFGLELVFREYGHVGGTDAFFRGLPDGSDVGFDDRLVSYLATHPLSTERIDALGDAARIEGWPESGDLRPFPPLSP